MKNDTKYGIFDVYYITSFGKKYTWRKKTEWVRPRREIEGETK